MISYDYYRVFYYAGKYRNFTRAADVLCTSQSNVSHCIQTLEHQLGCRLFIRKSRGIELTAEGETLYEHIARGCEQFMLGESAIHSGVGLDSGTIYLGATETALHYFLFDALDLFHARYPNVRFRVANFNTYEALGALQNGRIDLAVVTGPAPVKPPIVQKTLLQIHDVLFGGPRFRALAQNEFDLKNLSDYPFICLSSETAMRRHLNAFFSQIGATLEPAFETTTADLVLPMICHDLGLGILPREIARQHLSRGEIFEIPTKQTFPARFVTLLFDREHPQSVASKEFQNFLLEMQSSLVQD